MLSAQASGVEKVVLDAKGMSGVQTLRDYREGDEPRAEKSAQRAVLPNSGPKGQGYYSSWIALATLGARRFVWGKIMSCLKQIS